MAEQRRGSDGACEGDQIRHDVVDRSDKTPIDDVGAGHHEPTSERNGEEELDHGRKSLLRRKPNRYRSELDLLVAVAGIITGFPQGFVIWNGCRECIG